MPLMAATSFETILYETSDDHVATITLNRPEVLNAFDRTMCHEMRDGLARGQGRPVGARGRAARGRRPRVLRGPRHEEAVRAARRRVEPRGPGRAAEPEVAAGVEAGRLRGATASAPRARSTSSTRPTSSSAPTTRRSSTRTSRTGSCPRSNRSASCARSASARRCASRSPATTSASPRRPRCGSAS